MSKTPNQIRLKTLLLPSPRADQFIKIHANYVGLTIAPIKPKIAQDAPIVRVLGLNKQLIKTPPTLGKAYPDAT